MAPMSIEEVLTWTKVVRNTIFTPYCGMQGALGQLVNYIDPIKSERSFYILPIFAAHAPTFTFVIEVGVHIK